MPAALIFAILCLAWGTTWLAVKIGIADVPPLAFVGSRFLAAGLLLLLFARLRRRDLRIARADVPGVATAGVLVVGVTFGLIFWGEQYVSSGVTGVLVQGTVPAMLYGFAVLRGHEPSTRAKWTGVALGAVGVALLIQPAIRVDGTSRELLGMGAMILGAAVYGWGSVGSRAVLGRYDTIVMSGYENVFGGATLVAVSALLERDRVHLDAITADAVYSWLFLLVVGSLLGFTSYLALLRRWGASRASTYAFVTPLISLLVGVAFYDEDVRVVQLVGTAVMLFGVAYILRPAVTPEAAEAPESAGAPAGPGTGRADERGAAAVAAALPPAEAPAPDTEHRAGS